MKKSALLLFGGALAGPGIAAPVNIDFDSLGSFEVVDNQYLDVVSPGVGVDFNGSMRTYTGLTHSGVNFTINFANLGFGGVMRIDAVDGEFSQVGGWFIQTSPATMEVFSATDVSLASVGFNFGLTYGFKELTTADTGGQTFAYVLIYGGADQIGLDDFEAEIETVTIPLPTGAAMAGVGLCGLVVRRRR